jgi:predicted lipoprotein with Yx(FWY)xxD motif
MRRLVVVPLVFALLAGAALAAARVTVSVRSTPLGRVLAAANGHTLYVYKADTGKTSNCYGVCASFWPPLLATGAPIAGAGVQRGLLGTTKRKDGRLQITYAGRPLYVFSHDTKAGQTNGEDFQHSWWAVSPTGARVKPKASPGATYTPAPAPTTTQTITTDPGYGP